MSEIVRVTNSARETEAFAAEFAAYLRPGDLVLFTGGLGAGKTCFVRGVAAGLGFHGEVTSPTFAIQHIYDGEEIPLHHYDLYRIEGYEQLYATGFFDSLDGSAAVLVEWSENADGCFPRGAIRVDIRPDGENRRIITVTGDERFADFRN